MSALDLDSFHTQSHTSEKRALDLIATGKATATVYKNKTIKNGRQQIRIPKSIKLHYSLNKPEQQTKNFPSKNDIKNRDNHTCQIEGCNQPGKTVDHVTPKSKGGDNSWRNLVAMCENHNNQKSDKHLHETPRTPETEPVKPKYANKTLPTNDNTPPNKNRKRQHRNKQNNNETY